MTARAMWKGVLRIGDASVPVKLYSAIEDRDIHFRLLHATDLVPVTQAMVNPRTDEIVPHDQTQRGYAAPEGGLVIVQAGRTRGAHAEGIARHRIHPLRADRCDRSAMV